MGQDQEGGGPAEEGDRGTGAEGSRRDAGQDRQGQEAEGGGEAGQECHHAGQAFTTLCPFSPRVIKISLLYGILKQGDAYLLPT